MIGRFRIGHFPGLIGRQPNLRSLSGIGKNISKSDDVKVHSMNQAATGKTPITAQLWSTRFKNPPATSAKLHETRLPLTKYSEDSRLCVNYNFAADTSLRDQYANHFGRMNMGRLFEDIEALASNISFNHCDYEGRDIPINIITASIDKIRRTQTVPANEDLILAGQVVWAGKTSLHVLVELHRVKDVKDPDEEGPVMIKDGVKSRIMTSLLTYVCKDRRTGKSVEVNRFAPTTPEEEVLHARRSAVAEARKTDRQVQRVIGSHDDPHLVSLVEMGIAAEDMPALAHPNAVLMKETLQENMMICQPQMTNIAGRVYGGFLMRRAFDLAQATCYTFAGEYPRFLEIDEVTFIRPVDVGDLIKFKCRVIHTTDEARLPVVQAEVTCQVVRPERATSFFTSKFLFVFKFDKPVSLRRVLPATIEEAAILDKAAQWQANEAHELLTH